MGLFSTGVAAGLVLFLITGVTAAPVVANASSLPVSRLWGGADLSVRMTVSPRVAQPGRWLAYQVRVRNAGPGDAVLPVLTIKIPDEVEIAAVNVASCRPGAGRGKNHAGNHVGNEVVCPSPVDIRAGGTGAVTVLGVVRPGARGPLRASAVLTSEVVDENEADNRAEVVTQVAEGAGPPVRLSPGHRARPGRRAPAKAAAGGKTTRAAGGKDSWRARAARPAARPGPGRRR
ncbi:hypothetical protein AB0M95_31625 [Sphaerisporangium sp. NPDC051017]|uniref:hypothetical protein n=1 Tax=Sphaerisporangium sp. NPDC051017 TaxID=3154636 RepID=UPI003429E23C